MEKMVLVVCTVIGFLGIVSAVLAFAAEATKIKLSDVEVTRSGDCKYLSSPALVLGLVSALTLLIAQIIITVVTGCLCCKTHKRTKGLCTYIISWVAFVLAFLMLLGGAAVNDNLNDQPDDHLGHCFVLSHGFFSGAVILVLASVSLGITCYVSLSSAKNTDSAGMQNQGIAMGQPVQFIAQSNQPGSWAPQQNQGSVPTNKPPVAIR